MREIILLTKILLKSSTTGEPKKINKRFAKLLVFGLAYIYIMAVVGFVSYSIIQSLIPIRQEAIFLNLILIVMFTVGIVQTVITSLNILYFSKDLELLLPLPLKPIKIVMSKINCLIISQYILELLILLPAFGVYAYLLSVGKMFYVISIILFFIFPILPVLIATCLTAIIMRFTRIIKNKDFVQYITIILTIFLIFAIQLFTGTTNDTITNEELATKLIETNSLVENFSGVFPTVKPAMNAILNYNNINRLIDIFVLCIFSFILYLIVSKIISLFYVKTVLSLVTIKNKGIKKIDKSKDYYSNNIIISYVKKEFRNLNRNPIFFMQCVLPSILFPIIIIMPMLMTISDSSQESQLIKNTLEMGSDNPLFFSVFLIINVFLFMLNFASITSVSRDGENAVFMKYIPVDLKKQILCKILPGILLNILPIIYISIFLKITVTNINFLTIFYMIVISLLINIFNNYITIIVDLKNPKLKWITEYTVVKQNFNMIFEVLISIIEIGLLLVIGILFNNITSLVISLTILYIILIICINIYIEKNKNKLFEKII